MPKHTDRVTAIEARMVQAMTNEELDALVDGAPWLAECTDDELQRLVNGGPVPSRFAAQGLEVSNPHF